jgi:protein-tyrosine phosphatase
MVDLSAELPADTAGIVYRSVPILDLVAPTVEQLDAGAEAIEELKAYRPTLVCCALGYSRSAATMTAWLMASGKTATVSEAIALISGRRPRIILGSAQRERFEEWRRARTSR